MVITSRLLLRPKVFLKARRWRGYQGGAGVAPREEERLSNNFFKKFLKLAGRTRKFEQALLVFRVENIDGPDDILRRVHW